MSRKIKICKEKSCHNEQTTAGYCRYHYLKNWKAIKITQKKRSIQALNSYIEHICSKNPDNYVAAFKRDLSNPDFFSRQADHFLSDDDLDLFDDLAFAGDVGRLISHLKIDKAY